MDLERLKRRLATVDDCFEYMDDVIDALKNHDITPNQAESLVELAWTTAEFLKARDSMASEALKGLFPLDEMNEKRRLLFGRK